MNYSKIENLIKERKTDYTHFFNEIGMSKPGYYQMLKAKTLKVDVLEKIAKYFNESIAYFFDEDASNTKPVAPFNDKTIELYEENRGLLKEIKVLQVQIQELEKNQNDSLVSKVVVLENKCKQFEKHFESVSISLRQGSRIDELTIDRVDKIETVLEAQLRNAQTNKASKAVDKKGNSGAAAQEPITKPHNK